MARAGIDAKFDALHGTALREEANRALALGSGYALALAAVSVVSLPAVMLFGLAEGLWAPFGFTCVALGACALLHLLARRRLVWGATAWVVMLAFVSMPTGFYLSLELFLPSGAATFLNGPLSYLYLVLVAVTGCLFRFRLTVAAGLTASGGFLLCSVIGRDALAGFAHEDPLVLQDLVAPPIYAFRALMIAAGGFVVAGLAVIAKRLTLRVASEADARATINRLLGEYVSEEVREKLIHDPPPAEGEAKEVVVLFSDIRGFTTLSESLDASALVARLNEYFDAMVAPIRAQGGVVDKLIGDAIMATFGGVLDLEDPSGAAVRAALGMRAALAALNARWVAEGVAPIETGIGIHVGDVVIGSIGSHDRKDFTVIGDAVNTASRVEGLTKAHGAAILITSAVHERLPETERERCRALGEASVKGRAASVSLYAVA